MTTQFITNNKGKTTAVILPIKKYNKMIEELEEMEDIRLYDEAKKGKQQFRDAEDVFRDIEAKRKQA